MEPIFSIIKSFGEVESRMVVSAEQYKAIIMMIANWEKWTKAGILNWEEF